MTCSSLLAAAAACICLLLTISAAPFVAAQTGPANDIAALNYALTLERLESAFYATGQAQFSAAQFATAGFTGARDYFDLIAAHEAAHVKALADTITALGGTPVAKCTYSFEAGGFANVTTYVKTALLLESTGVSAYAGALNAFTSEVLMQVAATIATIEARHTSYLATLTGMSPFPTGTDTPKTPVEIVNAAAAFFTSCPNGLDLPAFAATIIIRPTGVATATTRAAAQPSSSKPISPAPVYTQAQFDNDMVALNYALTLEHLEAEFYNAGAARFNQAAFETAYPGKGESYFTQFNLIKDHENAHVTALTNVITARGGTAVPVCTYDFSTTKIPTIQKYVEFAQTLENTGVSAYDGAANTFTDTGLQQVAATIVTVEARHAAFLNGIAGASPKPITAPALDTATPPNDILAAVKATGLLTSCTYTLAGPVTPSSLLYTSSSSSTGRTVTPGTTGTTGGNSASSAAPTMMITALMAASAVVAAVARQL